jgi:predicted nucleic acid-binding protein
VTSIVFDTTALSHFARADRLEILRLLARNHEPILLAEVLDELRRGIPAHSSLGKVAEAEWLTRIGPLEGAAFEAFARYKNQLGGQAERNIGESAVLGWVRVNGGIAVIDERAARGLGQRNGLQVRGSLGLLVAGFKRSLLDRAIVESVVDDLLATGMHLPVTSGAELLDWAYKNALLP